jgi:hypothetical protein
MLEYLIPNGAEAKKMPAWLHWCPHGDLVHNEWFVEGSLCPSLVW